MKLPEFLTEWPDDEIVLTGHRISLYHVISLRNKGYTAEMIQEEYPTLTLDRIEKVLAFARENRAEVDAYITQYRADLEEQARTRKHLNLDELKRRWQAMGRVWDK